MLACSLSAFVDFNRSRIFTVSGVRGEMKCQPASDLRRESRAVCGRRRENSSKSERLVSESYCWPNDNLWLIW